MLTHHMLTHTGMISVPSTGRPICSSKRSSKGKSITATNGVSVAPVALKTDGGV